MMRTASICMAFLSACEPFAPTVLDFEATLPALREVGGIAATGRGFLVAGTVPETSNAERSDYALFTLGDDGSGGALRPFRARPNSDEQISGLLPLANGWLIYGHNGSEVRGLRLDPEGGQLWEGVLGTGQNVRAATRSADGRRVALVGSRQQAGMQHLWLAVFSLDGSALTLTHEQLAEPATEGWAIAASADGGFLLGGVRNGDDPLLLRADADGIIEPTNLHPRPDIHGRVGALLGLADGRHLLAGVEAERGVFGVFDAQNPTAWAPQTFCAGSGGPTRPVALAYVEGAVRIAGVLGYTQPTLWLYATDLTGESASMRTFGALTDAGAARIGLAFSAAGGVALASTLCEGDPCVGVPALWHMDPDGSGFGTTVTAECP
jgi:hypothetical protein